MPNTTTSPGSAASTGSAVALTASWQIIQVVPYAAATDLTERSSSRTANAISAFARTVTRALGGTVGTDSVKRFRVQNVLVHNHFRFRHTIRGRSGTILISRGRVLTHPFDDRPRHCGHTPTQSGPVRPWTVRIRSSSRCAPNPRRHRRVRAAVNHLLLDIARAFASGCVENTQFTRARAPNQSPTRSQSVTPVPHQVGRARKLLLGGLFGDL